MGVSRKCVKTWIDRYAAEGEAGLIDRSSRPHSMPTRTSPDVEAPRRRRCVAPSGAARTGWPPSSAWRRGRCRGSCVATSVPYLHQCDPITGEVIRARRSPRSATNATGPASWSTSTSRNSAGSPTAAAGAPSAAASDQSAHAQAGTDRLRLRPLVVDDHTRLAYSEVLARREGRHVRRVPPPSRRPTSPTHGIAHIEQVITDNHLELPALLRHPRRRGRRST